MEIVPISGDFKVLGEIPITADMYTNFFGEPLEYILAAIDEDPTLLLGCSAPYAALNVTQQFNHGPTQVGLYSHPNDRIVRYGSYTTDQSVTIYYGNHLFPSITGNSNTRYRSPDIVIEDADQDRYPWNAILPVIEGYVCRPMVAGERLYAIQGSQHGICGCNNQVQVGVVDFSEIGNITCIPFSDCTALENGGVQLPSTYALDNANIFLVIRGRLLPPNKCTCIGHTVYPKLTAMDVASWYIFDDALHGRTSPFQSVVYPRPAHFSYFGSEEYYTESFVVVVPCITKVETALFDSYTRLNRNRFLFQGLTDGFLVNLRTGLIQPSWVDRYSETQTHILKSDKRYHPTYTKGQANGAVYLNPDATEGSVVDIDYADHGVWRIFTREDMT